MIRSIRDATLFNKDVLLRVDLNVPFEKEEVSDTSRIKAIIPTINLVLEKGGRPILLSHLGRPKKTFNHSLSLKKILPILIETFKRKISFCSSLDQQSIKAFLKKVPRNKIILLENTRFFEGEEDNSPLLSNMFAELGDLYCNDAFSAAHRAHASTDGVAKLLPSYSGLLLEQELSALSKTVINSKKPVTAIIGGSKVSTKIKLLENLIKKVEHIIIAGGMANTFLYAQQKEIGTSICEKDLIKISLKIQTMAKKYNCQIHLPLDIVCAKKFKENQRTSILDIEACPVDEMILDCGPKTTANVKKVLSWSKTLIWNGPFGAFEIKPFNTATEEVAKIVAEFTKNGKLLSIVGGGDTISALKSTETLKDFTYTSNAGGAFLEWMEGKELPGLKALNSAVNE